MPNVELRNVRIMDPDSKYEAICPGKFKKLVIDFECRFNAEEVARKYPYKVDINLHAPLEGYAFNLGRVLACCTASVPAPNIVATSSVVTATYTIHVLTCFLPQIPAGLTQQAYPCCFVSEFLTIPFVPVVTITCVAPSAVIIVAPPPYVGCYGWYPRPCRCC